MIRVASRAESQEVERMVLAFRDHLRQSVPAAATVADSLVRLLADPDALFLVADDGAGPFLGYAAIRFRYSLWVAGIEAQVEDLWVEPDARQGGIGRALLAAAIDQARRRGAVLVGLTTNERNQAAMALYSAFGFSARRARWDGGRQLWLELEL